MLDAHEEGAAEVQLKETLAAKEALVAELEDAGAMNQYSNVGVSC